MPQVALLDPAHQEVVAAGLQVLEQKKTQHRGHGQRQQQSPGQGEGVGIGHGPEDLPFRSLHGEERDKRADHDRCRIKQGPFDFLGRADDALAQRQFGVLAGANMPVDILDHDDGGIDDDAEIHGPNREQIGRFAAQKQHAEGEKQRQRNIDGHNQGTAHVAQEHEQDQRHQHHAHHQVLADGFRGNVNQAFDVEMGLQLDSRQQPARAVVEFFQFGLDGLDCGQHALVLAHEHDAHDLVFFVVDGNVAVGVAKELTTGRALGTCQADLAEPRLMGDGYALGLAIAGLGMAGSPFHDVFNANGHVIDRGQDNMPDLAEPAFFFVSQEHHCGIGLFHPQHLLHRVETAADQADAPDVQGELPLCQDVGADVAIAVGYGGLQLLEGDAVTLEPVGVGTDFVALDGAPKTTDVGNTRQPAKGAFQGPILQGLKIVQGVEFPFAHARIVERIAQQFAGRRHGRDLRPYAIGQVLDKLQAVDHFLAGAIIIDAIVKLVAEVRQAEQGFAARVFQTWHACQGDLQRDGYPPLHLFGGCTGKLGDNLNDRWRRVWVGFHVDAKEGIAAASRQGQCQQNHDERAGDRPLNQFADHDRQFPRTSLIEPVAWILCQVSSYGSVCLSAP